MIELKKLTTHKVWGKEQKGFWLSVHGPWLQADRAKTIVEFAVPGKPVEVGGACRSEGSGGRGLAIWCEQDQSFGQEEGYDRFHGQLDFGNAGYHFAVVRVTVNAKGEWGLEDEDCPYGHDQDLRRPLGFEIEGVEGKWCLIFTPLS